MGRSKATDKANSCEESAATGDNSGDNEDNYHMKAVQHVHRFIRCQLDSLQQQQHASSHCANTDGMGAVNQNLLADCCEHFVISFYACLLSFTEFVLCVHAVA
eukprot:GHVU01160300.1.p1 GENE.GHVU01160300.1~~GHVU01160300.1.p1  ORF type:complete len:103 (-),score=10.75 GHVU01160300.1:1767-2075(-)